MFGRLTVLHYFGVVYDDEIAECVRSWRLHGLSLQWHQSYYWTLERFSVPRFVPVVCHSVYMIFVLQDNENNTIITPLWIGRIAALSIMGKRVPFTSVPYFWTSVFTKSIRYAGKKCSQSEIRRAVRLM